MEKIKTSVIHEWNCLSEAERQNYYDKAHQYYFNSQMNILNNFYSKDEEEYAISELAMKLFAPNVKEAAARRINAEKFGGLYDLGLGLDDDKGGSL